MTLVIFSTAITTTMSFSIHPIDYLSGLTTNIFCRYWRQADSIYILSGQGSYEDPERSRQLSNILKSKAIPHSLELWGADVNHDWPWWRKMLPHVLGKMVG